MGNSCLKVLGFCSNLFPWVRVECKTVWNACIQVVVFDSQNNSANTSCVAAPDGSEENESGAAFLVRILQYLETPQYLRKALFPKHNSLRFAVRTLICYILRIKNGKMRAKLVFFYF